MTMHASIWLGALAVGGIAAAVVACGGAADTGLFAGPSGVATLDSGIDASRSGSSSGSSSGSGSGSSSGSGSGSSGGSGSGSSGGSGSGSSSGSGSGGSSSGSSSGGDDAGSDPGIYCGTSAVVGGKKYCKLGSQDCCATGTGGTTTYRCLSNATSTCENGGGVAISCDDEAECPGQLCCGALDVVNNVYVSIQCQATCDPNQNQYVFCDPTAPVDVCASIASTGAPYTCMPSGVLPGYYRCSNGM